MAKDKPQPQGGPELAEYITTAEPKAYAGGVPVFCAHDAIVPLKDLRPNPKNPNQHPPEQIKLLASIIRATGWRAPITVSKRSGLVTKGHGRLMAAQLLDPEGKRELVLLGHRRAAHGYLRLYPSADDRSEPDHIQKLHHMGEALSLRRQQ